jgi:flagellar basal body-associated protein FliL
MEPDTNASPSPESPAKPASGKKKTAALLVITLVAAVGSGLAGALYGPSLFARAKAAPPPSSSAPDLAASGNVEKDDPAPAEALALEPLIVDVRHTDGELHHLKVGIALELSKPMPEEEMKKLSPRARDAAITYLRTLTLDEVTSPTKFEEIRTELGERVIRSMGKSRVHRVLFTDFVAQ